MKFYRQYLVAFITTIFLLIMISSSFARDEVGLNIAIDLSETVTTILEHQLPNPTLSMTAEESEQYYEHSKLQKSKDELKKTVDKDCDEENKPGFFLSALQAVHREVCDSDASVQIGYLMRISGRKSNQTRLVPPECFVEKKFFNSTSKQNCRDATNNIATNNNLEGLSYKQITDLIVKYLGVDTNNPETINDLTIRLYMGNSKSPGEFKNKIAEFTHNKSFDEKMTFISYVMGTDMADRYDYDRRDGKNKQDKGIIRCLDILKNLNNTTANKEGVCRDIAVCQVQLAKASGIHCEGLRYTTSKARHVNVVCYDPKNPRVIRKINYGTQTSEDGVNGPAGLTQTDGVGITYTLIDHRGKETAILPSELGTVLHEQLGGRADDLMPMIENPSTINSLDVNFGKYACGLKSNFFHGRLSNGDMIQGIAFSKDYSKGDEKSGMIGGKIGLIGAKVFKQGMQVDHLYHEIELYLKSPVLQINNWRIKADADGLLMLDKTWTTSNGEEQANTEFDGYLNTGLHAGYKDNKNSFNASYGQQHRIGFNDVRDNKEGEYSHYVNWESFNLGMSRELDPLLNQNVRVIGDFVHLRNKPSKFTSNKVTVGIEESSEKYGVMISKTSPTTSRPYMPGGTEKTDISVYYKLDKNTTSSIYCDQYQGEISAQCTLQLSSKW